VSYLRVDRSGSLAAVLLAGETFLDAHPFLLQHGDGILRHDIGVLVQAVTEDQGPDALLLLHRAHGLADGSLRRPTGASVLALAGNFRPAPGLAMADAQVFGGRFMRRAGDQLRRHREHARVAALAAGLARSGTRVEARRVAAWRRFDDDPLQLLEMNRLLLEELDPRPSELELPDTRIEGRVAIDPSAHIESSGSGGRR
jgi:glucose-1-phosphate thymidylyltransferase